MANQRRVLRLQQLVLAISESDAMADTALGSLASATSVISCCDDPV